MPESPINYQYYHRSSPHPNPPAPKHPASRTENRELFPQIAYLTHISVLVPLWYESFAQNKPNFLNATITTTSCAAKTYANIALRPARKNKPNQTQLIAAKPERSRKSVRGGPDPTRTRLHPTSNIRHATYEIRHTQYHIPEGFLPNPWPILSWPPGKCFSYNQKSCRIRSNGQAGSAPTWRKSWRLRRPI